MHHMINNNMEAVFVRQLLHLVDHEDANLTTQKMGFDNGVAERKKKSNFFMLDNSYKDACSAGKNTDRAAFMQMFLKYPRQ